MSERCRVSVKGFRLLRRLREKYGSRKMEREEDHMEIEAGEAI